MDEEYLRKVELASENELALEHGRLSEQFLNQRNELNKTLAKKNLVLTRLNEITVVGPDFYEDDCLDDCLDDDKEAI